jgi:hypothetical protein
MTKISKMDADICATYGHDIIPFIVGMQVNSYSLNSVGPTVESLGGGKRFLAVYVASALASMLSILTICTLACCSGICVIAKNFKMGLKHNGLKISILTIQTPCRFLLP